MKQIQAYIREMDKERLVDEYLYLYPIKYLFHKDSKKLTPAQINMDTRAEVAGYIDELASMEITHNKEKRIVIGYESVGRLETEAVAHAIVDMKELIDKGGAAENRTYLCEELSEVMGYYVAENEFTQAYIYEIVARIIYNMSLPGYDQENLRKAVLDIYDRKDESFMKKLKIFHESEGKYFSKEELFEYFGIPVLNKDEKLDELRSAITSARIKFTNYSMRKEFVAVKNQLLE